MHCHHIIESVSLLMQLIFWDIYVWYNLDNFLFPLVTSTSNCMHSVTAVHIDYSGNIQYTQNDDNKYILGRELSCIPIVRIKSTISKNIIRTTWKKNIVWPLHFQFNSHMFIQIMMLCGTLHNRLNSKIKSCALLMSYISVGLFD